MRSADRSRPLARLRRQAEQEWRQQQRDIEQSYQQSRRDLQQQRLEQQRTQTLLDGLRNLQPNMQPY